MVLVSALRKMKLSCLSEISIGGVSDFLVPLFVWREVDIAGSKKNHKAVLGGAWTKRRGSEDRKRDTNISVDSKTMKIKVVSCLEMELPKL